MNCKDCIHNEVCYRREVCNDIEEHIRKLGCMDFIARADVAEVRHGKWLLEREPNGEPFCFHCSVCESDFHHIGIKVASDYCPNCGAKMDGDNNNVE